jgi:hypothetical protein
VALAIANAASASRINAEWAIRGSKLVATTRVIQATPSLPERMEPITLIAEQQRQNRHR